MKKNLQVSKIMLRLLAFLFIIGCSETKKQEPQLYAPGFKTIKIIDSSRLYKPDTKDTDYLHYRPVDIDMWYPAKNSVTDSVLSFRDILGLLEQRANYYTASNAANGFTQQLAQYFCDGLKCSDTTRLLNFKTKSLNNATAIDSKFPMIIYCCAYNGMSYENFSLFECLAKKGMVVVSISSIGRYPGDMTMKKEDLMQQVNDALASVDALKQHSNIDFSKMAVIGYSWGGLSAAILSNKIPNVTCLASLDGSEFHHYGDAKEENDDFDDITNSTDFKALNISMPYLRLESAPAQTGKVGSVYNFLQKVSGEKSIFKIDSAQHEDFSCLSEVVRTSGNCESNNYYNTILRLTVSFIEDHLKNTNTFSQVIEEEKKRSLKSNNHKISYHEKNITSIISICFISISICTTRKHKMESHCYDRWPYKCVALFQKKHS